MNQAGSKFDSISKEGKAFAAALAKLAWKPIACWGSIRLFRRSDDTFTVASVQVQRAWGKGHDYYLVTESYDGRVELASIHTSPLDAAKAYEFHTRVISPFREHRGFSSKQYRVEEAIHPSFAWAVKVARRAEDERSAELREKVRQARRAGKARAA